MATGEGVALPPHVDGGPYRFTVQHGHPRTKDGKLDGEIHYGNLTITLRPERAAGRQRETMLHEAMHLAAFVAELKIDDEEETFITRTSPILLEILRRNPRLVAFLLAEEG